MSGRKAVYGHEVQAVQTVNDEDGGLDWTGAVLQKHNTLQTMPRDYKWHQWSIHTSW